MNHPIRFVVLGFCLLASSAAAKVVIVLNTDLLSNSDATTSSYAFFYLGSRAGFYNTHPAALPKAGEKFEPNFDEEVFAFTKTLAFTQQLQAKNEVVPAYWQQIQVIARAGFLREYIVVYRKRTASPGEARTIDVAKFKAWALKNLRRIKHDEVDRYGSIEID